jgi:hypothetical protein
MLSSVSIHTTAKALSYLAYLWTSLSHLYHALMIEAPDERSTMLRSLISLGHELIVHLSFPFSLPPSSPLLGLSLLPIIHLKYRLVLTNRLSWMLSLACQRAEWLGSDASRPASVRAGLIDAPLALELLPLNYSSTDLNFD